MASNPFFESELFNELNDALRHSSRFTATYRIAADDYAEAKKIARGIAATVCSTAIPRAIFFASA